MPQSIITRHLNTTPWYFISLCHIYEAPAMLLRSELVKAGRKSCDVVTAGNSQTVIPTTKNLRDLVLNLLCNKIQNTGLGLYYGKNVYYQSNQYLMIYT